MNAKFEKWWKDEKHGQYFAGHMRRDAARKGWNGAIQSLEVTPDILHVAMNTWLTRAHENPGYPVDVLLHEALEASLSALKEQAK